jgi:hypothetical protein
MVDVKVRRGFIFLHCRDKANGGATEFLRCHAPMPPEAFIARRKNNDLSECADARAHFDDSCDLIGVDKPRDPDNYCFERGAEKSSGRNG